METSVGYLVGYLRVCRVVTMLLGCLCELSALGRLEGGERVFGIWRKLSKKTPYGVLLCLYVHFNPLEF